MNLTDPVKPTQDDTDDDGWPADENFKSDQMWTPYGFTSADPNGVGLQEDTDTWSSYPGGSSKKSGDTGYSEMPTDTFARPLEKKAANAALEAQQDVHVEQPAEERVVDLNPELDQPHVDEDELEDVDIDMDVDDTADQVPELDDLVAAGHQTVTMVKVSIRHVCAATRLTRR